MSKKMLIAAATAMSLTATPVLAAAPAASSLSLAQSPRAAKATGKSEKLAGSGAIIAGVLALGVVAGGIVAVTNDGDSDSN